MATGTLTGQTIANTYKSLLKITGTTAGGETLHASTTKVIEDGDGNASLLQLSQSVVEVVGADNAVFNITSTAANRNGVLGFNNSADSKNFEFKHNSFDPEAGTNQLEVNSTDTANIMVFNLDGKIGIGTANPSTLLNLESATSTAITAENTGNTAVTLNLDADRSGADQGLGNINFKWNGTAVAQISGASGADTTNKDDGQIQFSTMSGGSSSVNMTLDKDGKLGIGCSAERTVHIMTSDASLSSADANVSLLVEENDHTYLELLTPNDKQSGIIFSDGSIAGLINYNHSTNVMTFGTNDGSTDVTISSAGNVGIGVAPEATQSGYKALQIGGNAIINSYGTQGAGGQVDYGHNFYYAASGQDKYISADEATQFRQGGGAFTFRSATSGSADAVITFTSIAKFDNNSRISLSNNDGGTQNTVFGSLIGDIDAGSNYNVFIGHNVAGNGTLADATENTAVGYGSLAELTSGDNNTTIGRSAGLNINSGANNTIVGSLAGDAMTNNAGNVIIGKSALSAADAGENYNIVIGGDAGTAVNNENADYNVLIGQDAGTGGTGAMASCIAIGGNAMNSTGTNAQTGTVAIGHDSLTALTSGGENLAIGYESMKAMTTGAANIAIGYQTMDALNHADADANIALGNGALGGAAAVALHSCVAIGHNALDAASMTDGANGTVAIGRDALGALTSGQGNTAIGYQAMDANTTGNQNTAVGYGAAGAIPGGALGNTAIGYNALANGNNDATDENTCIGHLAGDLITSGENNVIIGAGADVGTNTDSNSIVIGREAIGQGTNTVVLGNASHTDVYMASDKGANVNSVGITGWRGNSQWVRRTHEKTTGADTNFNTFATITPGGSNQYSYSEIVVTTTSRTNTSGETGFKTSRWYMKMDNGTMTVAQVGSDIDSGSPADFQIAVSSNVAQLQVASPAANTSWISIFVEAKLHSGFSAGNTWAYADV